MWTDWRQVPVPAAVVAMFQGEIRGHMSVHIAGHPWYADVANMSDADILRFWWFVVQTDTAQQDRWGVTPEQWLINQGLAIPPSTGDPAPGQQIPEIPASDMLNQAMTWIRANPLYVVGGIAAYWVLFGGRRRRW